MRTVQDITGKTQSGFPLTHCNRCGGSGEFGPRSVDGGRCFGCGGTGNIIAGGRKANEQWLEYNEALRKVRQPVAMYLQPGDVVRGYGARTDGKPAARREIHAIRYDLRHERAGTSTTGGRDAEGHYYKTVDPAPYLLAAGVC
jgi:hypothetical protein